MAVLTDPDQLTQGAVTAVSDLRFSGASGTSVNLDSAGTNLPTVTDDMYIEVRGAIDTNNNGLYRVNDATPTTGQITVVKLTGANPSNSAVDNTAGEVLGNSTTAKNFHYDTAARAMYIIEQNGLSVDGVELNAIYSFCKEEWKDDDFLRQFPFPMFAIDLDAGKYQVGTDGANANGWIFAADNTVDGTIRTRKLIRTGGWSHINNDGSLDKVFSCIITLGSFEDETPVTGDNAYYQFGTDVTVDDTVDFDFTGPVNEAIESFTRLADGSINGGTGVAISADGRTLTRSDGGNWRSDGFIVGSSIVLRDCEDSTMNGTWRLTAVADAVDGAITCGRAADANDGIEFADGGGGNDSIILPSTTPLTFLEMGYVVGSKIIVTAAEDAGNNGTHTILAISADGLTAEVATASFTANADDTTAVLGMFDDALTPDTTVNASIDNRPAFSVRLRVRDGDPNGKTFDSSNLSAAGVAQLNNFVFRFPLANATDLNISVADTGIDSDSNGTPDVSPYSGMTITYYSTPQTQAGLVGGSFDFGVIIVANGGTAQEVYEFVQWSLRATGGNGTGDIDNDGDFKFGRSMGDLLAFEGDILVAGGQRSENPDGGGAGVYISGIAASDQNNLRLVDNTGTRRQFPETISVTLDFNAALIDDTVAEYVLFFDRTIRTSVTDFVISSPSGPNAVFTSAGTNLPNNAELTVNDYIRVAGLTGADAAMNGIWQITAETTPGANWSVTRYDGANAAAVSATTANVDQNPVDSPDAIIVQDDTPVNVEGLASADVNFAFDFDGNTQGGRVVSTDTFVIARAIGLSGAQYVQSSVATISSGTPLTIVLTASNELNYVNA